MDRIEEFFQKAENRDKTLKIEEKVSSERSKIHEFCKNNRLLSITKTIKGVKTVFITQKSFDTSMFERSEDEIDLFLKYSGFSFPNCCPELFDYYIELYDRYYDCKNRYKLFIKDMSRYKNFYEFKKHIVDTSEKIIRYFNDHDLIEKYVHESVPKTYVTTKKDLRENIYKHDLCDQKMLSIDIRSANISVFNICVPEFFNGKTWEQFLREFTDSEFIITSKFFRELVCGKTKIHISSQKRYNRFLKDVFEKLKDFKYTDEDIICVSADEIVLKYKDNNNQDIQNMCDELYPNLFRVEAFTLKRIGVKPFYVKEHFFGDKKVEFKNCSKLAMCQVIKRYENREIEERDLTFFEPNLGVMAVYKRSIFD